MNNLKNKIYKSVKRRKPEVYLRTDFAGLAGYDQIGRALRELVTDGVLIRVGYGLYAKATYSPLAGDRPIPRVGIRRLGEEALRKLNVGVSASTAEVAYSEGQTTQVPSGRVISVDKRVRRKIGYNGMYLEFERTIS